MYDLLLISPHYGYDPDGRPIPGARDAHYQDLSMVIPLGIVHVAQYLHDCGFKVRVVHLPHEIQALQHMGLPVDTLDNPIEVILKHYPARICGLQAHFYLYSGGAVQIATLYRKLFPESTILVGGYMATAYWRDFLAAAPAIDGVVLGEGERTLQRVLEYTGTAGHGRLPDIDGLARRQARGELVCRPAPPDDLLGLDAMPLIDPDAPPFAHLLWPPRSYINISRGRCPEQCAYCVANSRDINPRAFRTMSIDRILEQMAIYQNKGIRGLFLGENQFLNLPFLKDLITEIIRADFNLYFELEAHPLVFTDKSLLTRMIAAGFRRYTMGCESGADSLLRRMGRRANTAQIIESVRQIAEAGGLVATSWICNLPGETAAEFQATATLLERVVDAGGFVYWIENLHVLPGSPLHRNPRKWDIKLLLKDLSDWFRWSLRSKTYVDIEDALQAPQDYLTHLSHNSTPREMVARFYALRRHARALVPAMQSNLAAHATDLPPALVRSERQTLDWYADQGWKLWLF